MGQEQIYLDYDNAQGCIEQMRQTIENLRVQAEAFDKIMADDTQLHQYWKGSSFLATREEYCSEYQTLLTKTLPNKVDELAEFIKRCTNAIKDVDNQLSV